MDAAEIKLWNAYGRDRSVECRNVLVELYLPWLARVAEKFYRKLALSAQLELDDLIAWGSMGLMDSIGRFDIECGVKFETFAVQRVHGAIVDGMRQLDWVPRLERTRHPDGDQIQSMTAMDPLLNGRDGGDASALSLATTNDADDPKQDHFWRQVCRGLSVTERLILILYWREGLTMKEVGRQLGLSESRVSQMHSTLLNTLRERGDSLLEARPGDVVQFPANHRRRGEAAPHDIEANESLIEFATPDYSARQRVLAMQWRELLRMNIETLNSEIEMCESRAKYLKSIRDLMTADQSSLVVNCNITVAEMERRLIETTLARHEGHRERTAEALGIGIRTLSGKLREYGYPPRGNTPVPESVPQSASVA